MCAISSSIKTPRVHPHPSPPHPRRQPALATAVPPIRQDRAPPGPLRAFKSLPSKRSDPNLNLRACSHHISRKHIDPHPNLSPHLPRKPLQISPRHPPQHLLLRR